VPSQYGIEEEPVIEVAPLQVRSDGGQDVIET
jgi:hypothetical protein